MFSAKLQDSFPKGSLSAALEHKDQQTWCKNECIVILTTKEHKWHCSTSKTLSKVNFDAIYCLEINIASRNQNYFCDKHTFELYRLLTFKKS